MGPGMGTLRTSDLDIWEGVPKISPDMKNVSVCPLHVQFRILQPSSGHLIEAYNAPESALHPWGLYQSSQVPAKPLSITFPDLP